jgi:hypothetical protein
VPLNRHIHLDLPGPRSTTVHWVQLSIADTINPLKGNTNRCELPQLLGLLCFLESLFCQVGLTPFIFHQPDPPKSVSPETSYAFRSSLDCRRSLFCGRHIRYRRLVKAYAVEPPLAIGTGVLDLQPGRKGHEGTVPQATARSVVLRLTNSLS